MNEQRIINELNSFCRYDSKSGQLIALKQRQGGRTKIGKHLGSLNNDGYLQLYVGNKNYLVHRLVWLLHYGEWPKNNIDHRDQNPSNNRIDNLRDVTQLVNIKNTTKLCNNTSGVTGVSWDKQAAKWRAMIKINTKTIYLGLFYDKDLAVQVRKEAEVKYGFSPLHGL